MLISPYGGSCPRTLLLISSLGRPGKPLPRYAESESVDEGGGEGDLEGPEEHRFEAGEMGCCPF